MNIRNISPPTIILTGMTLTLLVAGSLLLPHSTAVGVGLKRTASAASGSKAAGVPSASMKATGASGAAATECPYLAAGGGKQASGAASALAKVSAPNDKQAAAKECPYLAAQSGDNAGGSATQKATLTHNSRGQSAGTLSSLLIKEVASGKSCPVSGSGSTSAKACPALASGSPSKACCPTDVKK